MLPMLNKLLYSINSLTSLTTPLIKLMEDLKLTMLHLKLLMLKSLIKKNSEILLNTTEIPPKLILMKKLQDGMLLLLLMKTTLPNSNWN